MALRSTIPIVGLTLMVACASAPQAGSSTGLSAPTQLSPPDGTAFHTSPRRLEMQWSPVRGAASYAVEVDYFETGGWNSARTGGVVHVVPNMSVLPAYATDFAGDQFGRWRVWAVDANGRPGTKSEWLKFTWDTRPRTAGPDGVTPARSVYSPNPAYPASAARDKVGGQVLLNVTVGADGLVKEAVVLKSLRADLDEAALRTVKVWRFEPARKDGQPIERPIIIEIGFYVQ